MVDSPQEMCEEFNKFFVSVFTKEKLGDNTKANLMYEENDNGVCDIPITEEIVMKKLDKNATRMMYHMLDIRCSI